MALQVTLHVYSGRPDPVWTLTEYEEQSAIEMVEATDGLGEAPSLGLGYRGFSILRTDAEEDATPMVFENAQSDEIGGAFVAKQPDIEEFLLWTADNNIDDELSHYVRSAILSQSDPDLDLDTHRSVSCPPCGGLNAPSYNPRYWNNDATRRRYNNCYNYANNRATNTFAQPGRGSGRQYSATNCTDVGSAASRDGLKRTPTYKASTSGWYTALVIWPGRDYHWYRQDTNGCWSHKPGSTATRNTDERRRRIADPKHCDRGPYSIFCSYYVTNKGVRIR